jgi:hypothetical protein
MAVGLPGQVLANAGAKEPAKVALPTQSATQTDLIVRIRAPSPNLCPRRHPGRRKPNERRH